MLTSGAVTPIFKAFDYSYSSKINARNFAKRHTLIHFDTKRSLLDLDIPLKCCFCYALLYTISTIIIPQEQVDCRLILSVDDMAYTE